MATYEEPFPLEPTLASGIRRVFISCTAQPPGDPLIALADHLRAGNWAVDTLPTGHFSMITMPRALSALLLDRLSRRTERSNRAFEPGRLRAWAAAW